jgi:hypothetical protein
MLRAAELIKMSLSESLGAFAGGLLDNPWPFKTAGQPKMVINLGPSGLIIANWGGIAFEKFSRSRAAR